MALSNNTSSSDKMSVPTLDMANLSLPSAALPSPAPALPSPAPTLPSPAPTLPSLTLPSVLPGPIVPASSASVPTLPSIVPGPAPSIVPGPAPSIVPAPYNPKSIIADILDIEETDDWEINDIDEAAGLYLIHYTKTADLNRWGQIRGIVVDIEAGAILTRSFGYSPEATASAIVPSEDGRLVLTDNFGQVHTLNMKDVILRRGFEGVVIRVFKHNGKVYHSSHKKLNVINSRWGSSPTFKEMYDSLNGPTNNQLFDERTLTSPICHFFILVHPDVLVASKEFVGPGYIVYLGPKAMWAPVPANESPYKQKDANMTPLYQPDDTRPDAGYVNTDPDQIIPIDLVTELPLVLTEPVIYSPSEMTLDDANYHLRYGHSSPYNDLSLDERLRTGEFIAIYQKQDGHIESVTRVHSPAYQWRKTMNDDKPNRKYQFYKLLENMYIKAETPEGLIEFKRHFPIMSHYDDQSIKETIMKQPLLFWPQGVVDDSLIKTNNIPGTGRYISGKDARNYNIWAAFLMAVPLHRQIEVLSFRDDFYAKRKELITWIQHLVQMENVDDDADIGKNVKHLIGRARKRADVRIAEGDTRSKTGQILDRQGLVLEAINSFMYREYTVNIYRMIRNMDSYHKKH